MRVTTLFTFGLSVFGLLTIGTTKANAITVTQAGVEVIDGKEHLVVSGGRKLPIVPLRVEGEYFPGGPKFKLEGRSLHSIEDELAQHPLFNITAFGNSTLVTEEPELEKRSQQLYYCERAARARDGINPEDLKPSIDKLRRPPWQYAFCYAAPGSCTILACHNGAGIYLCNHRTRDFRTFCGSACGRFAQNVYVKMMQDKREHLTVWPPGRWPTCVGWWVENFTYTGWSKLDVDRSWEVAIRPHSGRPC